MLAFRQRIYDEFNLKKQADELGIKVWQTPSFLFIVMGFIIIGAMTGIYVVSTHYDSPEIVIISESLVVIILFTIGNSIIRTVEEIAKANKMKTEFVSIASHQLKTPISEMKWQTELLLAKFSEGLTEKQTEIVNGISKSGEKMGRLVNDLLDVARIDQGRLSLAKEKVNLCELIDNTVSAYRALALSSDIELGLSRPKKAIEVTVDKKRVAVAIDNIISNAIKYIDGAGKVEVFLDKKGGVAQISVRDNGVGIPKAEYGNVAKKFFRSSNSIKNQTEGTGLGLYIAKNIVEQSGGKFWFESIENVGSEFHFSFPVAVENEKV